MKLKEITEEVKVILTSLDEWIELMKILQENGFKWLYNNIFDFLAFATNTNIICHIKDKNMHCVAYAYNSITLSDFKKEYLIKEIQSVQVDPKFKVGDKVLIINYSVYSGRIDTIERIVTRLDRSICYYLKRCPGPWTNEALEPYTEPENGNNSEIPNQTNNMEENFVRLVDEPENTDKGIQISATTIEPMEEKELNLCELLKGCEGEEFYYHSYGIAILDEITSDEYPIIIRLKDNSKYRLALYKDGKLSNNGNVDLIPSRELYEKYPLDAQKAWNEWANERTPKRWHPKNGEGFWRISDSLKPQYCENSNQTFDWESDYNHFKTKELAEQAAEEIKKCLEKFHSDNKNNK